jgi:hypothetical protein
VAGSRPIGGPAPRDSGSGLRRDDCDASRRRLEGIGIGGHRRASGKLAAGQVPQAIPLLQGEYVDNKRTKLRIATALAWGVLAAALLFFTLHLFSNNNFAFGHEAGVSTQG